jgi:hypothetical protein
MVAAVQRSIEPAPPAGEATTVARAVTDDGNRARGRRPALPRWNGQPASCASERPGAPVASPLIGSDRDDAARKTAPAARRRAHESAGAHRGRCREVTLVRDRMRSHPLPLLRGAVHQALILVQNGRGGAIGQNDEILNDFNVLTNTIE